MDLSNLQPNTRRKSVKRVGRGGKRGTFSGGGTKGQKSRAGASVKPGFRGGDNRIWQLFPKQRGASKKPGSNRPHTKHRFYRLRQEKLPVLNLDFFNKFADGQLITPKFLVEQGLISPTSKGAKVLGKGELKRKLEFKEFKFSRSAETKITKSGGKIINESR